LQIDRISTWRWKTKYNWHKVTWKKEKHVASKKNGRN